MKQIFLSLTILFFILIPKNINAQTESKINFQIKRLILSTKQKELLVIKGVVLKNRQKYSSTRKAWDEIQENFNKVREVKATDTERRSKLLSLNKKIITLQNNIFDFVNTDYQIFTKIKSNIKTVNEIDDEIEKLISDKINTEIQDNQTINSGLETDIVNLVASIKNNDVDMFQKVTINKTVAQRYFSNNEVNKNSKLYDILNNTDLIESINLKVIRSRLNGVENMLSSFAIKDEKDSEITVYYSSNGKNCDGFTAVSISVDNKNYFLLSGRSGCGEYSISEMRTRFKTNLNIGFRFIDLRNIKVVNINNVDDLSNQKKNSNDRTTVIDDSNLEQKNIITKNLKIKEHISTAKMYYAEKDYLNAFVWYEKAANANNLNAQYRLGYMYRKGLGAKKSRKNAKLWWKKACKQGHKISCKEIEKMNAFGNSLLKSVANSLTENSNKSSTSKSSKSNTGFVGNWKADMGPKFGMPSTLVITKDNENYNITLDNKKFTGVLNEKNGRLNFRALILIYNKDRDELELLPYGSVYQRK